MQQRLDASHPVLTPPAASVPPGSFPDAETEPDSNVLFDVAPFRTLTNRHAVIRKVRHPTVVLGSTQRIESIRTKRAARMGVEVVRRRGGGGAVFLRPDDHLWIEAWVPRGDPLWLEDVGAAAGWVGAWWSTALTSVGAGEFIVHEGSAQPGTYGAMVCFSGKGPGEVFARDRKVMGVSQWRGREGALFHTCAYSHWDPRPLVELLDVAGSSEEELVADLVDAAIGLNDLRPVGVDLGVLGEALLSSFTGWPSSRS